jgi:hypothetical protein
MDAITARGTALGFQHRPEVALAPCDQEDHAERQDRIEEVRYAAEEDGERARRLEVTGQSRVRAGDLGGGGLQPVTDERDLIARPGRDEGDGGDRSGGGVHYVGQLLTRDSQPISERAQRVPDDQRVGVIVEEDGQAGQVRRQLSASPRRGQRRHRLDDAARTAAPTHQSHHAAQHQAEDDDGRMVRVGQRRRYERIDRAERRCQRVQADDEERAQPDPGEQRDHHLAEDESQSDGEQRW